MSGKGLEWCTLSGEMEQLCRNVAELGHVKHVAVSVQV